MSIIEKKPAQPNQSIIDSLTMLQAVVGASGPVGCTQLAREYGLDVTRVNRILGTLAYLGVLKRTRSRKYVAGAGVHVLATMSLGSSNLIRCSMALVKALERKTKMAGTVGFLWRTRVTYIHYGPAGQAGAMPWTGSALMPAHEAAIGRVLLAQYPNEEIRRQYKEYARNMDVDVRKLIGILDRVRTNGYAKSKGYNSVAVAIGDPAVAGLGLMHRAKDRPRIDDAAIPELVERLNDTAEAIAKEMVARRAW